MKIQFVPEKLHSNKKNEDFYCIKLAIVKDKKILQKSPVIMWITEEQYNKLLSTD